MPTYDKYRKMSQNMRRESADPHPIPVCKEYLRCKGCPFPANGFICNHSPLSCIRTDMARLHGYDLVHQDVTPFSLAFACAQEKERVTV